MDNRLWRRAAVLVTGLWLAGAASAAGWTPEALLSPCAGDCAIVVFAGSYVETGMGDIVTSPSLPNRWDIRRADKLAGVALARRAGRLWHFDLEPEIGLARRWGLQDETEVWGAVFARYRGFPWDRRLLTTVAVSTGLNWASDISAVERARAHDGHGGQLMHYFAPEVTFALPSAPESELVLRFHHRSGVFGLVSDAIGGAQYLTVGLRLRF